MGALLRIWRHWLWDHWIMFSAEYCIMWCCVLVTELESLKKVILDCLKLKYVHRGSCFNDNCRHGKGVCTSAACRYTKAYTCSILCLASVQLEISCGTLNQTKNSILLCIVKMYICLNTHMYYVHMDKCVHVYVQYKIYLLVYMYICIHTCVLVMCVCTIHIYAQVCTTNVYTQMYVYYIWRYMYTHIYALIKQQTHTCIHVYV